MTNNEKYKNSRSYLACCIFVQSNKLNLDYFISVSIKLPLVKAFFLIKGSLNIVLSSKESITWKSMRPAF